MGNGFELTGAAGWSVILAPVVFLAIAMVAAELSRWRRNTLAKSAVGNSALTQGSAELSGATGLVGNTGGTSNVSPAALSELQSETGSQKVPAEKAATGTQDATKSETAQDATNVLDRYTVCYALAELAYSGPRDDATHDDVRAGLEEASKKKSNGQHNLAPAHIYLALHSHMEGNTSQAAGELRAAIGVAMRRDDKTALADARLALGDVCQATGDGITACEHWHMARELYAETGNESGRKAAIARMEQNGCPTDWVLTDF